MQRLTAEQFEQITDSLRSDRSLRIHEKRQKPRVGLRCSLEVFTCDPKRGWSAAVPVWIRDVSAEGLGLVSNVQMKKDMAFVAEFGRSGTDSLYVMYQVAYSKQLTQGLFSVGARVVRVIPAEQISEKLNRHRRAS